MCKANLSITIFFFFARTIGIKKISGGIGNTIDSKKDTVFRNFIEFLFSDNLIELLIILKTKFFI